MNIIKWTSQALVTSVDRGPASSQTQFASDQLWPVKGIQAGIHLRFAPPSISDILGKQVGLLRGMTDRFGHELVSKTQDLWALRVVKLQIIDLNQLNLINIP